ncbi:MAG TPA: hypothetical protein VN963_03405, partial [bacterium]|nr:hypothetical protein [bacterium]
MYFSFRTTQLKDIGQCLPLIQDPCFSTPENHKHLLAFWNYVLSEDVALSSVVVDHGRTPHKIVGFEMSLFVR